MGPFINRGIAEFETSEHLEQLKNIACFGWKMLWDLGRQLTAKQLWTEGERSFFSKLFVHISWNKLRGRPDVVYHHGADTEFDKWRLRGTALFFFFFFLNMLHLCRCLTDSSAVNLLIELYPSCCFSSKSDFFWTSWHRSPRRIEISILDEWQWDI